MKNKIEIKLKKEIKGAMALYLSLLLLLSGSYQLKLA